MPATVGDITARVVTLNWGTGGTNEVRFLVMAQHTQIVAQALREAANRLDPK